MPGTSPLQLYSYPLTTDQASPAGIQTLAQAIEKQVVAIFPDTGTRDSRWTSATGLANGAMCFITATGELQLRSAGAWVVIGGRAAPFATATGLANYSISAAASVTVTITFPTNRFSVAPGMLAGAQSAGATTNELTFRCFNITATGASIAATHYTTSSNVTVTGETLAWFAHQYQSAAGVG